MGCGTKKGENHCSGVFVFDLWLSYYVNEFDWLKAESANLYSFFQR